MEFEESENLGAAKRRMFERLLPRLREFVPGIDAGYRQCHLSKDGPELTVVVSPGFPAIGAVDVSEDFKSYLRDAGVASLVLYADGAVLERVGLT